MKGKPVGFKRSQILHMVAIAFLGTGLMGRPMARRLLVAGFSVTVWNRTRHKAEALFPYGARLADTPASAVQAADVVILMLETGAVVTDILFQQGVAAHLKTGATVIDMSSIPPSVARDHGARLAEAGVHALDSPVSGGTIGAEEGTLAIMVGGAKEHFTAVFTILQAMGRPTYVGPAGSGQLAKLANQSIVATSIAAVAEALLLAERGGADPVAVRQAIRGGFAESRILDLHGERMLKRDFTPHGPVRIFMKDLDTILSTAAQLHMDMPFTQEARRRYAQLRDEMGGGDLDHSALFLQMEATMLHSTNVSP